MSDLIRDTVFGHLVRFITKGRVLQYIEEKDPSIWKQYINRDQTKNMALYGHPHDDTPDEKQERESSPASETQSNVTGDISGAKMSGRSSQTNAEDGEHQLSSAITGLKIDPEKGRDTTMVTWFGEDDPEVRNVEYPVEEPVAK